MNAIMKKTTMRVVVGLGFIVYVLVFFFGWEYSYSTIAGTLFSNTRIMIYLLYIVLLLIMMRVYGGFQFGKARVGQLIYSQFLAEVITVGIIYVLGVTNSRVFFNPLPLLGIVVIQSVLGGVCTVGCNKIYYKLHKAKKSVVIYKEDSDLTKLQEIEYFADRFTIEKYIKNPTDIMEIMPQLEGYGVVFVVGIEATLRNGIAKYCVEKNVMGYIYPHTGDVIMMGAEHMQMFSVPLVRIRRSSPTPEYLFAKRVFDIVVSLIALVVSSPFMLITVIMIKAYDRGPVLYKQVRLTKDGKEFKILKFRSMKVDAEKDGVARLASENDDRITPVGHIIRACRLDELPQIFNILKGDMSIVGPRPERPEIAKVYEKELPAFNLRLQCKAGLTGYAQVYGRYNTEPKDKLKMDLMYIRNMCMLEDLKICFYTVKILFMKESTEGIAEGQTTAVSNKVEERV